MKPSILKKIFEAKKRHVAQRRESVDVVRLMGDAREKRADAGTYRLRKALQTEGVNIIAEFKRASPSKGIINDRLDTAETARAYERGGASAISVLTEEDYFKGSLADLRAAREAVAIPILQKDFIFDDFQVYEAAAAGADAVLLIVAMLDDAALAHLHQVAEKLGMDALVEVHDQAELARAKEMGAMLIGVNNRNLKTFDVSLDISRDLIKLSFPGAVMVTESGLRSRADITGLKDAGFNGFLIGETLMKATDPEQALRGLIE